MRPLATSPGSIFVIRAGGYFKLSGGPGRLRCLQRFLLRLALLLIGVALSAIPVVRAAGVERAEYVSGEVIVKLKGKPKSLKAQAFIGKVVSEKEMALKGSWAGLNMHHFALKPGASVEASLADLRSDPDVEYAEPNYILRRMSTGLEAPLVALGTAQGSVENNFATSYSMTSAPIELNQTWSSGTTNANPTIVAVIDTGLDMTHDVFVRSSAIWTNPNEILNGLDDDANGFIDDIHGWNFVAGNNAPVDDDGHGTHVSGIILGVGQNIFAASLSTAKIRIMPLKFLDSNGSGSTSDAVKAIYYAVNNGAKVLNNSWGGGGFSNALLDAIVYAYNHQAVFVAAAGNAASNNDSSPTYPANYNVPNVISIAATTDSDYLASFSNYGAQTVHMGAPGYRIWSTYPGNMVGSSSGTSMAAPFVSGVAALMLREAPTMNGYQLKSIMFEANQVLNTLSGKTSTQSRLASYDAINAAKLATIESSQPVYDASLYKRAPAAEESDGGDPAGGCGLVAEYLAANDHGGPTSPQKSVAFFALLLVLVAPVALSIALRSRDGRARRRFPRYQIDSQVRVKFGDRELVGQVSTISLGGVQLNTDAWLENGGIVKMSIRSPDGKDEVEVEGQVVWSEEKKHYGVAFAKPPELALSSIHRWTQSLLKT